MTSLKPQDVTTMDNQQKAQLAKRATCSSKSEDHISLASTEVVFLPLGVIGDTYILSVQ